MILFLRKAGAQAIEDVPSEFNIVQTPLGQLGSTAELGTALARHHEMSGLVATGLALGLVLAERYRPEVVFLDLGVANVHAFDACRVLSSLTSRAQRRCRVVAGTATVTDALEKPALMAGAASVSLFPFTPNTYQVELDRLEERLGPRKLARK